MADKMHTLGAKWREADAKALLEREVAVAEWLDHTEDLVVMFGEENNKTSTELRSMMGMMRSLRNDYSSKAGELRAELADQNGSAD